MHNLTNLSRITPKLTWITGIVGWFLYPCS